MLLFSFSCLLSPFCEPMPILGNASVIQLQKYGLFPIPANSATHYKKKHHQNFSHSV